MHFFLLKVLENCQNLLYDHPVTYDLKKNYFINRTFIFKTTYIPYCSIKVVNQFKNGVTNVFDFKDVVNTK